MVIYEVKCMITGKSYIGKNQKTLKTITKEHIDDTWRVMSNGKKKFGNGWFGSGDT